ncbi:MAG: ParA family protein [Chloroflexales bacterium]|nr:ParA family protein [Chloroflexales bacterium]
MLSITFAGFKSGVGKTTSAVHFAAYLHQSAPTLLVDGDPNRSALTWARHGKLPCKAVEERSAARYARAHEPIGLDLKARPDEEDLKALVEGCDLLIIPSKSDPLSIDALLLTINMLRSIGAAHDRVLLAIAPPRPSTDVERAHEALEQAGYPVFQTIIRRTKAFEDAAAQGVLVNLVTSNALAREAWNDYVAAAQEVCG